MELANCSLVRAVIKDLSIKEMVPNDGNEKDQENLPENLHKNLHEDLLETLERIGREWQRNGKPS